MTGIGSEDVAASANSAPADLSSPGRALKNDWLINDVAASEVADRHDQTCAAVAVTKIELDRIGPSAAVPSFGMCPEPSPIKPSDLPERARHRARGLLPKDVWPASQGCAACRL